MSDDSLTVCPKCQGKLTRIFYPTGVVFKGSGFYTTDYKGSGKEPSGNGSVADSDKKPETKSDPKSEAKPESKPESKPETKPESKSESKSDSSD
jgi:hypothetical protein